MEGALDLSSDLNPNSGRRTDRLLSRSARTNRRRRRNARRRQRRQRRQPSEPLPVHNHANEIVRTVRDNQVVVITAETGCGKSSQVPQMLLRQNLNKKGTIVCTQPRRVAARELAMRVAKEMNITSGFKVGYHVRFENHTNKHTVIKYMTDGILLRECLFNAQRLQKYSIIILDEVHERTTQMDLLFGFMKKILRERPKLRLVIMSATMDTDSVSKFFNNAPVLNLEGSPRHHVEVRYDPGHTNEHVLKVVRNILNNEEKGDILVFLPGIPEIQQLKESLSRGTTDICIFVAHSQVPIWEMDKIFDPAPNGKRKVILSTNVTESSVTIEGLRFVVDTGYVNVKVFNPRTGVNVLETRLISESEAQQRRGRVGRTAPGVCYRLYRRDQLEGEFNPEDDANRPPTERRFKAFPEPQIERDDLTHVLLVLKLMGCRRDIDFPWITKPKTENVDAAVTDLCRLGALRRQTFDLTEFGKKMVKFPLHPRMAAAVLKSTEYGCEYGALLLAAILSVFNGGRQRSLKRLVDADQSLQRSDEVETLMWIMQEFNSVVNRENDGESLLHRFATRHKIHYLYILEAAHVYDQLFSILTDCDYNPRTPDSRLSAADADVMFDVQPVLKRIFATNVGTKGREEEEEEEEEEGENDFKLPNGVRVKFQPTLVTTASRSVLRSVAGIEVFCLSDIRGQRRDLSPRMVNTFIPVNDPAR